MPANICLRRPYKERAAPKSRRRRRRQVVQQGCGISSKHLKFVKKVAKEPITRKLGKMASNKLPNLYNKETSKIKNKKIKTLLQSDLADSLVGMGTEYDRQRLG